MRRAALISVSSVCLLTPGALFSPAPAGAGSAIIAVTAMAAQVASILDMCCFSNAVPRRSNAPTCHLVSHRFPGTKARRTRGRDDEEDLTPHPPAAQAWRNQGAARAVLLDVAGSAFTLGFGAGIVEAIGHR